jgi:hypothetical protein
MRYAEFKIVESLLFELTDKVKNKMREKFKDENPNLGDEKVNFVIDNWDKYASTFDQKFRDITRLSFSTAYQMVDDALTKTQVKGNANTKQFDSSEDTIYDNNNLLILKGNLREKCIQYGGGYKWCISRTDASNLFYSYRMNKKEPMFYFVFDKDRRKEDRYHAMVIYVDNEGVYNVANAFNHGGDEIMTWSQIISNQPKLRGLRHLFNSEPLTDEERGDYEKFGKPIDEETYQKFSLKEKYKYLQFNHALSEDQQLNTPDVLIGFYAKQMPLYISSDTWDRLSPRDKKNVESGQIRYVSIDGGNIRLIKKPSERVQMAAVKSKKNHSKALEYILDDLNTTPSIEVQIAAVSSSGYDIAKLVRKNIPLDYEVKKAAVSSAGGAIQYITNPDEGLQMIAVKDKGFNIYYIGLGGTPIKKEVQVAAIANGGFKSTTERFFDEDVIQWGREKGYI